MRFAKTFNVPWRADKMASVRAPGYNSEADRRVLLLKRTSPNNAATYRWHHQLSISLLDLTRIERLPTRDSRVIPLRRRFDRSVTRRIIFSLVWQKICHNIAQSPQDVLLLASLLHDQGSRFAKRRRSHDI